MEHRWGKRSVLDIGIQLHLGSGAVDTARITNASLSGAFVNTTRRLPAFTRVVVEVPAASVSRGAPRRVPAYVVRTGPDGLGLEWQEFAPPAITSLLGRFRRREIHGSENSSQSQSPRADTNANLSESREQRRAAVEG
jgi:hypothetical protein